MAPIYKLRSAGNQSQAQPANEHRIAAILDTDGSKDSTRYYVKWCAPFDDDKYDSWLNSADMIDPQLVREFRAKRLKEAVRIKIRKQSEANRKARIAGLQKLGYMVHEIAANHKDQRQMVVVTKERGNNEAKRAHKRSKPFCLVPRSRPRRTRSRASNSSSGL